MCLNNNLRGRNTQVNAKIPWLGIGGFYNCVNFGKHINFCGNSDTSILAAKNCL
jgi:hypothetical protein